MRFGPRSSFTCAGGRILSLARHLAVIAVVGAALLPSTAAAQLPPTIGPSRLAVVQVITPGEHWVRFAVNPNGSEVTDCHVDWSLSSAEPFEPSIDRQPCSPAPGGGTDFVEVAVTFPVFVTGHYTVLISATNAGGTATVMQTVLAYGTSKPPTVMTGVATNVTATSVTLKGTVRPNGSLVTECRFEYGPTNAYGQEAPCATLPGSGGAAVPVSATVPWPGSGTLHYRLVARNADGTSTGADAAFHMHVDNFPLPPAALDPPVLVDPPVAVDPPVVVDPPSAVDAPGIGTAKVAATRRSDSKERAVDLVCSGRLGDVCRGTLALSARARLHGRRRSVPLGRAAYALTAPHSATVVVPLTRRGRRLLARHPRVQPIVQMRPSSPS